MGYTGDPYSNCVDIDECAYPDLNTCAGGLNSYGVDADLFLDADYYINPAYNFYLGEPEADGFTQVLELQIEINLLYKFMNFQSLQFELKGAGRWKIAFSENEGEGDNSKRYRISREQGKFKLGMGNFHTLKNVNGWDALPTNEEFKSYIIRYET